ncbi:energy coupling factor transporter S component ThiW [Lutibacter sp. B2]|nr:energy coupling factor transporter S component ThiW [Lutibacter sp. B2]
MNTKKLVFSSLLIGIATITGHLIYIPIGVSKIFPVQHTINILSAIWLGPWAALSNAFIISLLRNFLGTGSLLAFPGSMIGAFLAGIFYKTSKKKHMAILGEIFGTGILGGLLSFPIAKFILGANCSAFFFIVPFLTSSIGGSMIASLLLSASTKFPILKEERSK